MLGSFDSNYDKNKFMIMCNQHRPFILSPDVRENYSIIQNSVRKFAEILEKALEAIDLNKQKLLSIVEKNETKPSMTLKEKRFIFREVEKQFIKYQLLFINLKKEKCDWTDKDAINIQSLLKSGRRDSRSFSIWFKIDGIVDENQFKTSWVKTYSFTLFPWKNIKFKLWNQIECYNEYTNTITSQNDFIENVLSIDKIRDIYRKFSLTERWKLLSKLRGKVAVTNSKYKIRSIETKNIDSMDTEETLHSEKFNSQPTNQKHNRAKRHRKPATVKKRDAMLIKEDDNSWESEAQIEELKKEVQKDPFSFEKPNFKEIYNLKENKIFSNNTKKREKKRLGKVANKSLKFSSELNNLQPKEEALISNKSVYDAELKMEVIQEIPSNIKSEDSEIIHELQSNPINDFCYWKCKRYGVLKVYWSEGTEKWENKGVFHKNWVKKFKSIKNETDLIEKSRGWTWTSWIKRLKYQQKEFTFQDPVLLKEDKSNEISELRFGEIDMVNQIEIMNVNLSSTDYLNKLYQQNSQKTSQSKSSESESWSSKSKGKSKACYNGESEESEDSGEDFSKPLSIVTQESE